jgi:hypothetical protein
VRVEELIPKTGFFPQYLQWVRRLTDAPEVYHVAAGLAVMSATVSNLIDGEFGIKLPDGTVLTSVFPTNLWMLMVGPSGDRKSTAMDKAIECAQPAIGAVSAIHGSFEGTVDLISQKPDIFFYHSEGSTLFSQLQASYWLQGQGTLCDLFDGRTDPPYIRTLTGQRTKKNPSPKPITISISRPRVTMLIGIAPDMLDQTRKSDWTGGLIGRMLLIYGELTRLDETPPKKDDEGRQVLTDYLAGIRDTLTTMQQNNAGLHVGMRSEPLQVYMDWARKLAISTKNRPPKIRTLFRRLPMHILRAAALFAVSQYHDTITMESMAPAIRFGDLSARSIERVGDLLADDPVLRTAIKIRDMLDAEDTGIISVAKISQELRLSWSAIEPAIRTLQMIGYSKVRNDEENPDLKWVVKVRPDQPPDD